MVPWIWLSLSSLSKPVKLPKNYDPKATPDPERWLPMRERSYYRGKRHKRREGVSKGTQGATSAGHDYDAGAQPGSPRAAAASPVSGGGSGAATPATGTVPRQQRPMPNKQKKKKKGGKW